MTRRTYSQAQITEGLAQLVANGGDVSKTSKEVDVPDYTLRSWKTDTHAEQYRQLEEAHGTALERQAVELARATLVRAAAIEDRMLDRIEDVSSKDLPQALRAVADVKAKAGNQLMQLTNRPTDPKDPAGMDIMAMLRSMEARGLAKLAVGIEVRAEAVPADNPSPAQQPRIGTDHE